MEKKNPLIKGTLPRGRHLAYQALIVFIILIASAMSAFWVPAFGGERSGFWGVVVGFSGNVVAFLAGMQSLFLLVKRLHDAGRSGVWVLFFMMMNVVLNAALEKQASDITSADVTVTWLAFIVYLVGVIIICALPSKLENNPWR